MSEDVWVLGASMTKIGRYPDKDVIDLASEASHERARRRRRHDPGHGRAGGGLHVRPGRHRPADPEADRPDRHPRLQRAQRVRHRRHRGAHRLPVDQGRRSRHGHRHRRRADGQDGPARARRRAARRTCTSRRVATAACFPPTATSAPARCPRCSARRAWSTPTSTTASASSSSPRSPRRTTRTRR